MHLGATSQSSNMPVHGRDASGSSSQGFSTGAKQLLIATTIVGGTLVLLALAYALYRRRHGPPSLKKITHRRDQSTILEPGPIRPRKGATQLPIYRETEYTVDSASRNGSSLFDLTKLLRQGPPPPKKSPPPPIQIPNLGPSNSPDIDIISQFPQTPHTPHTPHSRRATLSSDLSNFVPDVPDVPNIPSIPSLPQHHTRSSTDSILQTPPPAQLPQQSPPASPISPTSTSAQSQFNNPQDRWSWTNSQAPVTPRYHLPDRRASLLSLPPFRPVSSWIRTQPGLIEEEQQLQGAMSRSGSKTQGGKMGSGIGRKLSKTQALGRSGSLMSIFRKGEGRGKVEGDLEMQRKTVAQQLDDGLVT